MQERVRGEKRSREEAGEKNRRRKEEKRNRGEKMILPDFRPAMAF